MLDALPWLLELVDQSHENIGANPVWIPIAGMIWAEPTPSHAVVAGFRQAARSAGAMMVLRHVLNSHRPAPPVMAEVLHDLLLSSDPAVSAAAWRAAFPLPSSVYAGTPWAHEDPAVRKVALRHMVADRTWRRLARVPELLDDPEVEVQELAARLLSRDPASCDQVIDRALTGPPGSRKVLVDGLKREAEAAAQASPQAGAAGVPTEPTAETCWRLRDAPDRTRQIPRLIAVAPFAGPYTRFAARDKLAKARDPHTQSLKPIEQTRLALWSGQDDGRSDWPRGPVRWGIGQWRPTVLAYWIGPGIAVLVAMAALARWLVMSPSHPPPLPAAATEAPAPPVLRPQPKNVNRW